MQAEKAQGNSNRFGEKGFFPRHVTNNKLSKKESGVSGWGRGLLKTAEAPGRAQRKSPFKQTVSSKH